MNPERSQFLNLRLRPARMNAEEAAWYLGFSTQEMSILTATHLVKPLGAPPSNASKYFAAVELERLRSDPKWLAKACDTILKYWRLKNSRKAKSRSR